MDIYQSIKHDALWINERIGPLRIPIVPPGVNPDDILPLIIEEKKRREYDEKMPYSPLIIPDTEEEPPKPC